MKTTSQVSSRQERISSRSFLQFVKNPVFIAFILIVILFLAGEFISPGFASGPQIIRLLTIAALLGFVAAGQNLVILGGQEGIDLSIGGMVSLGAVIAGNIMHGNNSMILFALVGAVTVCATIGFFNGMGILFLRIPPLVMTLGMLGVVQGGLVVVTNGIPSGKAAPMLMNFISKPLMFNLPGILWIWIVIGILMWLMLHKTGFGLNIYAIGSNVEAARLTGISVGRIRVILYMLSGAFAGFTGVCLIGYTGTSFIGVGEQYMLSSIIAVVIGGTSLAGGVGSYWGTIMGATLLVILQSILTTLNMEEFGRQIIFGATLLILMFFYGRGKKLRS